MHRGKIYNERSRQVGSRKNVNTYGMLALINVTFIEAYLKHIVPPNPYHQPADTKHVCPW